MNNGFPRSGASGQDHTLPLRRVKIYVALGRERPSDIEVEVDGLTPIKAVLRGRFTHLICKYYQARQADLAAGQSEERAGWRLACAIAQDLSVEEPAVASYRSAVNGVIREVARAQTTGRIASLFETRRNGGSRISPAVEIIFES